MPSRDRFQWDDPLLLAPQLTEEERQVRDAFRHEQTDAAIHALILDRATTGIAAF